jgi:hypothetical protein
MEQINLFDGLPTPIEPVPNGTVDGPSLPSGMVDASMDAPLEPTDPRVQEALIAGGEWYEPLWQGMPEFAHANLLPVKSIKVHFLTWEAVEAFAVLMQQPITQRTRWLWYPRMAKVDRTAVRYRASEEAS